MREKEMKTEKKRTAIICKIVGAFIPIDCHQLEIAPTNWPLFGPYTFLNCNLPNVLALSLYNMHILAMGIRIDR